MAVEVRQMIVKSNVVQRQGDGDRDAPRLSSHDRKLILAECRNLIMEALREEKER